MLSSMEVMFSCVKGVSAHVEDSSAHLLLLIHTSSRSSICRQGNGCFSSMIKLICRSHPEPRDSGWGRGVSWPDLSNTTHSCCQSVQQFRHC